MDVLNTVLPIFLVIGLGLGLRRGGLLTDSLVGALSKLVFFVFAPALLLRATATNPLDGSFDPAPLFIIAFVSLLVGGGVYLLCFRCHPDRRGVIAQGAFRSNQVFIGLPIVVYAFGQRPSTGGCAGQRDGHRLQFPGDGAANPAPAGTVCKVTPGLEPDSSARPAEPPHPGQRIRHRLLVDRPPLPVALDRALELLGRTAAPLALLTVGAGLEFERLRGDLGTTLAVTGVKTILYPILILVGLRMAGLSGLALKAPLMLMVSPTAVIGYVMTRELGGDVKLSGAIVVGSTLVSILTITAWLAWLG